MASDLPFDETARPPFVATARAEARSDHSSAPAARKNSCQKVLSGWSRCPIGATAQEPAEDSTEVASEMRIAAGLGYVRALEVPPHAESVQAPITTSPSSPPTSRGVRGRHRGHAPSAADKPELIPGIARA